MRTFSTNSQNGMKKLKEKSNTKIYRKISNSKLFAYLLILIWLRAISSKLKFTLIFP